MLPQSLEKSKDNTTRNLACITFACAIPRGVIDKELQNRHIPSYLPCGENGKRVHPAPTTDKAISCPWDKMTFAQKKDLLMVDEERCYRMEYAQENGFAREL